MLTDILRHDLGRLRLGDGDCYPKTGVGPGETVIGTASNMVRTLWVLLQKQIEITRMSEEGFDQKVATMMAEIQGPKDELTAFAHNHRLEQEEVPMLTWLLSHAIQEQFPGVTARKRTDLRVDWQVVTLDNFIDMGSIPPIIVIAIPCLGGERGRL